MKPMAFLNLFAGTLLLLTAASLPETTFANACGMQYKALPSKKKPNTKRMQKNIYNYGRTLVRFNGSKLEWSDNNGTTWYEKSWRWFPGVVNSPSEVYDVLQWKDVLLAFTTHGIYASKNGCQTWEQVASMWPQTVNPRHLEVVGDEILSISENGVYASKNGGKTWEKKANKW